MHCHCQKYETEAHFMPYVMQLLQIIPDYNISWRPNIKGTGNILDAQIVNVELWKAYVIFSI